MLGLQALFKGLGVIFGILAISWLVLEYFLPSPPSRITMATGAPGTSLHYFGQRYRERLASVGIDVDLRETADRRKTVSFCVIQIPALTSLL